MKNHFSCTALFLLALITLIPVSKNQAQGIVAITTTVKNNITTAFECQCPKDENGDAFTVDIGKAAEKWNDDQIDEFSAHIDEFEKINGIHILSKYRTKDPHQTNSTVDTKSTGPLSGPGKKLCDFLRKNR